MTSQITTPEASIEPQLIRIRDQQRETWDTFSVGWKKWDELVLQWLSSVGEELIRNAQLHDTSTC